jgi:hypothetical protein
MSPVTTLSHQSESAQPATALTPLLTIKTTKTMNRFTTLMLALTATITLTTTACKKGDDSTQPTPVDNTPAFVGKNLMMTSFQINPAIDLNGDGTLDNDLMIFLEDCDKDNTIIFEKNGKLSGSNGALVCTNGDDDPSAVEPSHWTYNAQTKTLKIIKDSDATDVSEWKVVEASASGLKVEIGVEEAAQSYKTIMTWKAI